VRRQDAAAILMDYYPHNLREMLQAQGKLLSFREKLLLLQRVTASVSWLASNYICHRDIKPENIMISQERLPKLVDFGSCCPVYGAGPSHLQVSETRRKCASI
jgi:serine/threonine protein kinase